MFPLSIRKSLLIETTDKKEQFSKELVTSLAAKFDSAKILQEENGYSITFPNGFSNSLLNFKWMGGGNIEIAYQGEQVKVEYEVFFISTFVVFCFASLFYLVVLLQKAMPWSNFQLAMGVIWAFYLILVSLTSIVFTFRISKSIHEVQVNHESISQEQLAWINSEDRCPACGYGINKSTRVCPDCQLQLK